MKKITFIAALVAVVLSSCSKNEVTNVAASSDNVDRIGVRTGVGISKGVDMVGSSLHSNDIVLSYKDAAPSSSTLSFSYNTAKGEWDDNTAGIKWNQLDLPATFYSFCDEDGDVAIASGYGASANLESDYSVSDVDPENHNDLLYMSEVVGAVPAGGNVYATFRHALSKVDLVSKKGDNYVVGNYVAFNNLQSAGTPTVTASHTASTIKWVPAASMKSYTSLHRLVALEETPNPKPLADGAIISNDGASTNSTTANMKLIPQTIGADYDALQASIKACQKDDSYESADYSMYKYIEVMYRMNGSQGERVVGFENAANYPNFDDMSQEIRDDYTGKPLYVKAAFVLSTDLVLEPSSYYKLNLNFNTFGGLLMDDYYYDQNGDRTDFKVLADIETGDPIIPSDDTVIGITVVVDEWTPESDTDMQ